MDAEEDTHANGHHSEAQNAQDFVNEIRADWTRTHNTTLDQVSDDNILKVASLPVQEREGCLIFMYLCGKVREEYFGQDGQNIIPELSCECLLLEETYYLVGTTITRNQRGAAILFWELVEIIRRYFRRNNWRVAASDVFIDDMDWACGGYSLNRFNRYMDNFESNDKYDIQQAENDPFLKWCLYYKLKIPSNTVGLINRKSNFLLGAPITVMMPIDHCQEIGIDINCLNSCGFYAIPNHIFGQFWFNSYSLTDSKIVKFDDFVHQDIDPDDRKPSIIPFWKDTSVFLTRNGKKHVTFMIANCMPLPVGEPHILYSRFDNLPDLPSENIGEPVRFKMVMGAKPTNDYPSVYETNSNDQHSEMIALSLKQKLFEFVQEALGLHNIQKETSIQSEVIVQEYSSLLCMEGSEKQTYMSLESVQARIKDYLSSSSNLRETYGVNDAKKRAHDILEKLTIQEKDLNIYKNELETKIRDISFSIEIREKQHLLDNGRGNLSTYGTDMAALRAKKTEYSQNLEDTRKSIEEVRRQIESATTSLEKLNRNNNTENSREKYNLADIRKHDLKENPYSKKVEEMLPPNDIRTNETYKKTTVPEEYRHVDDDQIVADQLKNVPACTAADFRKIIETGLNVHNPDKMDDEQKRLWRMYQKIDQDSNIIQLINARLVNNAAPLPEAAAILLKDFLDAVTTGTKAVAKANRDEMELMANQIKIMNAALANNQIDFGKILEQVREDPKIQLLQSQIPALKGKWEEWRPIKDQYSTYHTMMSNVIIGVDLSPSKMTVRSELEPIELIDIRTFLNNPTQALDPRLCGTSEPKGFRIGCPYLKLAKKDSCLSESVSEEAFIPTGFKEPPHQFKYAPKMYAIHEDCTANEMHIPVDMKVRIITNLEVKIVMRVFMIPMFFSHNTQNGITRRRLYYGAPTLVKCVSDLEPQARNSDTDSNGRFLSNVVQFEIKLCDFKTEAMKIYNNNIKLPANTFSSIVAFDVLALVPPEGQIKNNPIGCCITQDITMGKYVYYGPFYPSPNETHVPNSKLHYQNLGAYLGKIGEVRILKQQKKEKLLAILASKVNNQIGHDFLDQVNGKKNGYRGDYNYNQNNNNRNYANGRYYNKQYSNNNNYRRGGLRTGQRRLAILT